jgi:hypothetical protein
MISNPERLPATKTGAKHAAVTGGLRGRWNTVSSTVRLNKVVTEFKKDRLFLLIYISLAALCLFTGVQAMRDELPNANWLARTIYFGPLLFPGVMYATGCRPGFLIFAAVLIPLQVLASFLALYTVLGIASLFVPVLVWANLVPMSLHLWDHDKARIASWVLGTSLACGILLTQAKLGLVLIKLERESKQIVSYAYEQKLRTGKYPENLDLYVWKHDGVKNHFTYYGGSDDDKFTYPFKDSPHYNASDKFSFRYHVGSTSTGYWYSSRHGWWVEDD